MGMGALLVEQITIQGLFWIQAGSPVAAPVSEVHYHGLLDLNQAPTLSVLSPPSPVGSFLRLSEAGGVWNLLDEPKYIQ